MNNFCSSFYSFSLGLMYRVKNILKITNLRFFFFQYAIREDASLFRLIK